MSFKVCANLPPRHSLVSQEFPHSFDFKDAFAYDTRASYGALFFSKYADGRIPFDGFDELTVVSAIEPQAQGKLRETGHATKLP